MRIWHRDARALAKPRFSEPTSKLKRRAAAITENSVWFPLEDPPSNGHPRGGA
ncbi:MAG: hypothetical protein KatS3mg130_0305 [Candidatus Sumerlaea sp.]|jgi:hypothetical protein|nr:MAG: hypothetical protein KatS3mg130_0305 [Candidatus Sumerlaea sp.]